MEKRTHFKNEFGFSNQNVYTRLPKNIRKAPKESHKHLSIGPSWSSVVHWTWQFWVLRPNPCKGQWFHDVSQLNSALMGELVASSCFFFDCHRFDCHGFRQVLPPENGSRPGEPLLHITQIFHIVAKKKFKEHEMKNRVVANMNFYQKISMPCDED